jgi:hypothetical protein
MPRRFLPQLSLHRQESLKYAQMAFTIRADVVINQGRLNQ